MVNGNMACGPIKNGLRVRVGPDAYEQALEQPEASELGFTGRPMRGMLEVGSEALLDVVRVRRGWLVVRASGRPAA